MGEKVELVLLGAGLTCLSAAYHTNKNWLLIEQSPEVGGLAKTNRKDGFAFDITGHWLHLANKEIQTWIETMMGDELELIPRKAMVYSNGRLTDYPYQINTCGLPPEIIRENLVGFFKAINLKAQGNQPIPKTFADWIRQNLGEGFAKNFMFPYNTKIWTVPPSEISASWCDRFVPRPSIEQVIDGALGTHEYKGGYNATFLYPKKGGIDHLPKRIALELKKKVNGRILLNEQITSLDLSKKQIFTQSGKCYNYTYLISSLPLKHFCKLLTDPPVEITDATNRLKYTSVIYYDLSLAHFNAEGAHWVYFPEEQFSFYRLGEFSAANRNMAPVGKHSVYVEIAHRGGKTPEKEWHNTLQGLLDTKFINDPTDIVNVTPHEIECAYVIMDKEYEKSVQIILDFLSQNHTISTGRYGRWTYSAMEDALIDGKVAAEYFS